MKKQEKLTIEQLERKLKYLKAKRTKCFDKLKEAESVQITRPSLLHQTDVAMIRFDISNLNAESRVIDFLSTPDAISLSISASINSASLSSSKVKYFTGGRLVSLFKTSISEPIILFISFWTLMLFLQFTVKSKEAKFASSSSKSYILS